MSTSDVAAKFKKVPENIDEWEAGESSPTYPQLEKLAYEIYKRPIAIFFYPEPPDEPSPQQAFRTLPELEADTLLPDTRYAIRQGQSMQLALQEILGEHNPVVEPIFRVFKATLEDNPIELARGVRDALGITLEQQARFRTDEESLEAWRNAIQDSGVFVFKRSFKQKDVSGFCLLDNSFPIIYINNSTAPSRQTFTLLHELCHILLGISDLLTEESWIKRSEDEELRRIEAFCNQFAASVLLPTYAFSGDLESLASERRGVAEEEVINLLARKYRVSRQTIVREYSNRGLITQQFFIRKVQQYNEEYKQARENKAKGGGDYYATQAAYLGERFLSIVFSGYYQGHFDLRQAADYLNVKPQNLPKLEETWDRKVTSQ